MNHRINRKIREDYKESKTQSNAEHPYHYLRYEPSVIRFTSAYWDRGFFWICYNGRYVNHRFDAKYITSIQLRLKHRDHTFFRTRQQRRDEP